MGKREQALSNSRSVFGSPPATLASTSRLFPNADSFSFKITELSASTPTMLSILRKARLKDKEMRILMLYVLSDVLRDVSLTRVQRAGQCRQNNDSKKDHEGKRL